MRLAYLFLGVILTSLLVSSCDWGNPYASGENDIDSTDLNFINIVIGIDMTDRILENNQIENDVSAIERIIDKFHSRQKRKYYKSLDRLTIEVVSEKKDNMPSSDLSITMTPRGGREKSEIAIDKLKLKLIELYDFYKSSPSSSKDLYSTFRDYLPGVLLRSKESDQITYSNKFVLITNGLFNQLESIPMTKGINSGFVQGFLTAKDWRGNYDRLETNIEPLKNETFDNLQVLLLGIGNDVSSGEANSYLIIRQFWTDWLDKMGIESTTVRQGTFGNSSSSKLDDYFSSKHFIDRYSFPFESSGAQYYLSYLEDNEIVENNQGVYFRVSLTNSTYSHSLNFGNGKYIIKDIDRYKSAFIEFADNVLKHIDKDSLNARGYKIFVKGSADALGANSFRSSQVKPHVYDNVCYLPKANSENQFSGPLVCRDIPENFSNSHLPNLRGRYIIDLFSLYLNQYEIPIQLEGNVTYDISKGDRNAIIYLYLPNDLYLN